MAGNDLEGAQSLGAARTEALFHQDNLCLQYWNPHWFHGCEGPHFQVRNHYWSLDRDLEGIGSLGAAQGGRTVAKF